MTTDLFVYGTLQDPDVLGLLLRRMPVLTPVTVPGWRVAPVTGQVYPGLVRDPDASADGHHLRVDDAQFAILDAFEAPIYERAEVGTAVVGAEAVSLVAWVVPEQRADACGPGTWSLDGFLADPARTPWLAAIRRGRVAPSTRRPAPGPGSGPGPGLGPLTANPSPGSGR